ncbi:type I protein arginine methyltransferase [Malassezia yamatoensis]|uniref:type I protein arginine methyltransferase n=1 Tax=Malassezia yamatoensis TaxID=253288 RepID=A0AAJ5YVG4_9BASI|nr:type I protein arginine methyltransferase [Malassezia yamatoensis]
MDVGAGNGILSLFAIQAGAEVVYAVEASSVVSALRRLVEAASREDSPSNAWLRDRLAVVHARIEKVDTDMLKRCTPGPITIEDGKVDTIISECLGVLLVHERMCESFIEARDRFLKPGGAMFPRTGTLCFSLLNDARLYQEVRARGEWWNTNSFYGVDLTPFADAARTEAFSSPVVGCFSPTHIVGSQTDPITACSTCPDGAVNRYMIDFSTISMDNLRTFDVPIALDCVHEPVVVHGLGAWFDLSFLQPEEVEDDIDNPQFAMTTSPFAPATHWAQIRLLFPEPLAMNTGQCLLGTLHFQVNERRSYDIQADLYVPLSNETSNVTLFRRKAFWKLDNQTYSWETTGI